MVQLDTNSALFISDLHLSPEAPEITERFFRFLATTAPNATSLFILGDLFEAWIGDDDLAAPLHVEVVSALKQLSSRGVDIALMQGNRDFLLGEVFCTASGARLLDDPTVIELNGERTLLLHGDTLCTDDIAYQQFRLQAHNPAWQQAMLAKSLDERRAIARHLREQSEHSKDGKTDEIMDVNDAAVTKAFLTHACSQIIHGHTHRPAQHPHLVQGRPATRWVLPDWHANGGYLRCDAQGCALHSL